MKPALVVLLLLPLQCCCRAIGLALLARPMPPSPSYPKPIRYPVKTQRHLISDVNPSNFPLQLISPCMSTTRLPALVPSISLSPLPFFPLPPFQSRPPFPPLVLLELSHARTARGSGAARLTHKANGGRGWRAAAAAAPMLLPPLRAAPSAPPLLSTPRPFSSARAAPRPRFYPRAGRIAPDRGAAPRAWAIRRCGA
jgi:hypothetical protein